MLPKANLLNYPLIFLPRMFAQDPLAALEVRVFGSSDTSNFKEPPPSFSHYPKDSSTRPVRNDVPRIHSSNVPDGPVSSSSTTPDAEDKASLLNPAGSGPTSTTHQPSAESFYTPLTDVAASSGLPISTIQPPGSSSTSEGSAAPEPVSPYVSLSEVAEASGIPLKS